MKIRIIDGQFVAESGQCCKKFVDKAGKVWCNIPSNEWANYGGRKCVAISQFVDDVWDSDNATIRAKSAAGAQKVYPVKIDNLVNYLTPDEKAAYDELVSVFEQKRQWFIERAKVRKQRDDLQKQIEELKKQYEELPE